MRCAAINKCALIQPVGIYNKKTVTQEKADITEGSKWRKAQKNVAKAASVGVHKNMHACAHISIKRKKKGKVTQQHEEFLIKSWNRRWVLVL